MKPKTKEHGRRWVLRLFEWGLLFCIVAVLGGMFLNRMGRIQAEIERRNFQSTVMAMQAAVLLQSVVRPEDVAPGDDPAAIYNKQFGLLPADYVGRLDRPDPAAVAGGGWYFDTGKRQLVYRVRCVRYFRSNLRGPPRMRLEVVRENGSSHLSVNVLDDGNWTVGEKDTVN